MKPLYERLKYEVPLRLKGFEKLIHGETKIYNPSDIEQLMFNSLSSQENYDKFKKRVFSSLGKTYLPIYRIADGEFIFCLGKNLRRKKFYLLRNIKRLFIPTRYKGRKLPLNFKEKFNNLLDSNYCINLYGEGYTSSEKRKVKKKYIDNLREIATKGYLGIHFIKVKGELAYAEYVRPMCAWFDQNKIYLNDQNYISFYFVYALLNGDDRKHLYNGKRVLIVTHADEIKKAKIRNKLEEEGVRELQFYQISYNKSLFDKIDLNKIKKPVDLILVGAGIGSSNILVQLEPLQTVCIDAGINIECLANPLLKKSRIFLASYNDIN